MNEICLHCHWLYFSSIILSFEQCVKGYATSELISTHCVLTSLQQNQSAVAQAHQAHQASSAPPAPQLLPERIQAAVSLAEYKSR